MTEDHAARPRHHSTLPYEKDPRRFQAQYSKCPSCGGIKKRYVARCFKCLHFRPKTEVSNDVFYQKGKPCRYIGLTDGKVTVVSAHRYGELSQYDWKAQHNVNGDTWYAKRWDNATQRSIYMHRQIVGGDSLHIDHKDGDGLNNADDNLRPATCSQNLANQKLSTRNKSGYKGVHWYKNRGRWFVNIEHNGKTFFIGYFDDKKEAARAYNKAALEHFGEFARINHIDDDQ